MSDPGVEPHVEGRPTAGAALAQQISDAEERRAKSRNVRALGRLIPFIATPPYRPLTATARAPTTWARKNNTTQPASTTPMP